MNTDRFLMYDICVICSTQILALLETFADNTFDISQNICNTLDIFSYRLHKFYKITEDI